MRQYGIGLVIALSSLSTTLVQIELSNNGIGLAGAINYADIIVDSFLYPKYAKKKTEHVIKIECTDFRT